MIVAASRARYVLSGVGSSKYSGLWERQESSMHRSSRSLGDLDAGYVRVGGLVEDDE